MPVERCDFRYWDIRPGTACELRPPGRDPERADHRFIASGPGVATRARGEQRQPHSCLTSPSIVALPHGTVAVYCGHKHAGVGQGGWPLAGMTGGPSLLDNDGCPACGHHEHAVVLAKYLVVQIDTDDRVCAGFLRTLLEFQQRDLARRWSSRS